MILKDLDIKALDEEDAERALKQALEAARVTAEPALPANAETRAKLVEALAHFAPTAQLQPEDADLAKDTLLLLQQDADCALLRTDTTDGPRHARSDFSGGPFEYLEQTTLALIALSTYVQVQRGKDGKWSFAFGVKPQTDAMKKAFLKLVSGLVAKLPGT